MRRAGPQDVHQSTGTKVDRGDETCTTAIDQVGCYNRARLAASLLIVHVSPPLADVGSREKTPIWAEVKRGRLLAGERKGRSRPRA